jgi:hypothetical protein
MMSARWSKHATDRIRERFAGTWAFFEAFLPGKLRCIFRTEGVAIISNCGDNRGVLRFGRDGKPINLQGIAEGPKPVIDHESKLSFEEVTTRSQSWLKALDESLNRRTRSVEQASGLVQDVRNAILCNKVTAFLERRMFLMSSHGIFIFSADCTTLISAKKTNPNQDECPTGIRAAFRRTFESHFVSAVKDAYKEAGVGAPTITPGLEVPA